MKLRIKTEREKTEKKNKTKKRPLDWINLVQLSHFFFFILAMWQNEFEIEA